MGGGGLLSRAPESDAASGGLVLESVAPVSASGVDESAVDESGGAASVTPVSSAHPTPTTARRSNPAQAVKWTRREAMNVELESIMSLYTYL